LESGEGWEREREEGREEEDGMEKGRFARSYGKSALGEGQSPPSLRVSGGRR